MLWQVPTWKQEAWVPDNQFIAQSYTWYRTRVWALHEEQQIRRHLLKGEEGSMWSLWQWRCPLLKSILGEVEVSEAPVFIYSQDTTLLVSMWLLLLLKHDSWSRSGCMHPCIQPWNWNSLWPAHLVLKKLIYRNSKQWTRTPATKLWSSANPQAMEWWFLQPGLTGLDLCSWWRGQGG